MRIRFIVISLIFIFLESAAYAAPATSEAKRQLVVCVFRKTGELSSRKRCGKGYDRVDLESLSMMVPSIEGVAGAQGPKGDTGPQGAKGDQGIPGLQGADGQQGVQGDPGPQGPSGPQGATGPSGPQGATGPSGPQGATGPSGPQGATGPSGPQGATGPQGPIGPRGPGGGTIIGTVPSCPLLANGSFSVNLIGSSYGTILGSTRAFRLESVMPGTYTLVVSQYDNQVVSVSNVVVTDNTTTDVGALTFADCG